jgi:hypothetical protein
MNERKLALFMVIATMGHKRETPQLESDFGQEEMKHLIYDNLVQQRVGTNFMMLTNSGERLLSVLKSVASMAE